MGGLSPSKASSREGVGGGGQKDGLSPSKANSRGGGGGWGGAKGWFVSQQSQFKGGGGGRGENGWFLSRSYACVGLVVDACVCVRAWLCGRMGLEITLLESNSLPHTRHNALLYITMPIIWDG